MFCLGQLVMGKNLVTGFFDWSICLRPGETFSVANNMKCHIKVILAIFVGKSNQKAEIKSKILKAKISFVNVPPG